MHIFRNEQIILTLTKIVRLIDRKYIHILYVIYLNLNIYNHVKIGVIVLNGNDDDDDANSKDDLDDVEPLESSSPPLPDPNCSLMIGLLLLILLFLLQVFHLLLVLLLL